MASQPLEAWVGAFYALPGFRFSLNDQCCACLSQAKSGLLRAFRLRSARVISRPKFRALPPPAPTLRPRSARVTTRVTARVLPALPPALHLRYRPCYRPRSARVTDRIPPALLAPTLPPALPPPFRSARVITRVPPTFCPPTARSPPAWRPKAPHGPMLAQSWRPKAGANAGVASPRSRPKSAQSQPRVGPEWPKPRPKLSNIKFGFQIGRASTRLALNMPG